MNILKHGTPKHKQFHCDNCGCDFEAEEKEWVMWYQTDGFEHDTLLIGCPDCGFVIEEEQAPKKTVSSDVLKFLSLEEGPPETYI